MNILVKHILIIIFSFLLFYWIQTMDDKKYKVSRETLFEKYKNSLLMASLVGLLLNMESNMFNSNITNLTVCTEPIKYANYHGISNFNIEDFISFPPPFP